MDINHCPNENRVKLVYPNWLRLTFKYLTLIIIMVIFKHLSLKALSTLQDHEGGGGTGWKKIITQMVSIHRGTATPVAYTLSLSLNILCMMTCRWTCGWGWGSLVNSEKKKFLVYMYLPCVNNRPYYVRIANTITVCFLFVHFSLSLSVCVPLSLSVSSLSLLSEYVHISVW